MVAISDRSRDFGLFDVFSSSGRLSVLTFRGPIRRSDRRIGPKFGPKKGPKKLTIITDQTKQN